MFSQHDTTLPPNRFRFNRLIGRGIFHYTMGMDTTFMGKCHLTDHGLVDRQRDSCQTGYQRRELVEFLFFYPGGIPVEDLECHDNLFKRRITRPFPKAIDRHMGTGGPALQRSHGVGNPEPEIVMTVDRERCNLCDRWDKGGNFFRRQKPYRVTETKAVCSTTDTFSKDLLQEGLVRPGCILPGEFYNEP